MSKYYHATPFKNMPSILEEGIRLSYDGVVYLCKSEQDAAKFAIVHACNHFVVFEVELKDKDVVETFDHSETFFRCRCYGSTKHIDASNIKRIIEYNLTEGLKLDI